ncbi:DNA replication/repair protein RecF [Treponema sp. OMZ 840]|uniref:DNA replication/repair protein RecF n=1 Tax=Treponema sp. OMZ 840 TaxID=244313 RepID=UPI003D8FC49B
MPFLSVSPINFRNLKNNHIDCSAPEVFFVGENGQGKTNILETLYIISYGSSFRTKSDNEIIKEGENFYSIRGFYRDESGKADTVSIQYEQNKKKILKNAKVLTDRKDLIQTIPCVLFCHDDLSFAVGEPERRRFFIDQSLSMYDILYVDILRKYKRVLKSRNAILRDEKAAGNAGMRADMLDVFDTELAAHGREMVQKRRSVIHNFNRVFTPLYEDVTGIKNVSLAYDSAWKEKKQEEILCFLREKRERDIIMKTTLSGPHRDSIYFTRYSEPFVPTASTGQRRLAAILLRVCQAVLYTQICAKKPVLLMDDVLLELDPAKREKITALLPAYDQLFCTFLPEEPYSRYMKSGTKVYEVREGQVYEQ